MEQQTKQSNDSLTISQPAQKSNAILGWLAEQITVLAEAMGEPMTQARLKIYIGDLSDLQRSELEITFARARRELKFFPKIAELRELAGKGQKQEADAEARAAWDALLKFVAKFVSNDIYGNYGPEHGWYPKAFPKPSNRILDCVRRSGGWKAYACMTNEDFPFQQKRFFEEFLAWSAVEHVAQDRMLITHDQHALPEPKREAKSVCEKAIEGDRIAHAVLKTVPAPMTEAQIRDRREILRQQTQLCRTKYNATRQGECNSLAPQTQEQANDQSASCA
jgi:hypothetical protein